ncbi:protein GAMETE EXPRESSED 2 [Carex littledalei]|uniref:Protein GAMETE EXPRESSED 2 n=1 Tax=Carex littledalei TaxID=544730 RepID=A0A833R097_9POAL|nr:protein GAMETE EXPRESSED 2 [Carex littledalei]
MDLRDSPLPLAVKPGMSYSSSHLVYEYKVFIGYCDRSKNFANGSGLASSTAGRMPSFMVFLTDHYNNPSLVKAESFTSSSSPVQVALLFVHCVPFAKSER